MKDLVRSKYLKVAGIYKIFDEKRKRNYIGSSGDLYSRINSHKNQLINNKHINPFLQRHVNKYGIDSLEVVVLEVISPTPTLKFLLEREQFYLDIYYNKNCFNGHKKVTYFVDNLKIRKIIKKANIKNWENNYDKMKKIVVKNLIKAQDSAKHKISTGELVMVAPNKGIPTSIEVRKKQSEAAFKRGRHESVTVPIYKYNLNGIFIEKFTCIRDAARSCNNNAKSAANLRDCATGNRERAYGFIWKFIFEEKLNLQYSLINMKNNEIIQFINLSDIAIYLNCHPSTISSAYTYNKIIFSKYRIIKNE